MTRSPSRSSSGKRSAPPPPRECAELFCPVGATISVLQQKWSLAIVHALTGGKMRLNELAAAVGGANSRTVRERLKTLEEEGIVSRHVVATMPPWVEYELTPKGQELRAVMESIAAWAIKWMKPPR